MQMIRVPSSSPDPLILASKGFLLTEFAPSTLAYSEPCQTSTMERSAKIINEFQPLNIIVKRFI